MSLHIDRKFVSYLAPKLPGFHQKSDYLWNFRCPLCGDSRQNKRKMRGYLYRRKSDLFFSCHNCGASVSFGNFLKHMDRSLYNEYQMERFKNESHGNTPKPDFSFAKQKPVFNNTKRICLPTIESLDDDHSAKRYLVKRKIPKPFLAQMFYANDFKAFVDEIIPDNGKELRKEDPRIVIPFYDEENNLLGFQGRAVGDSKIKYITIKIADENQKVFGLDKVDKSKTIYVVEGPIDAMFLQNSLAMMDATLYNAISYVGDYDYVFVYDNEPRNKDVIRHMKRTIELGQKICIWPKNIKEKDINAMALAGLSPQSIIDSNTFSNQKAMLEFTQWTKS